MLRLLEDFYNIIDVDDEYVYIETDAGKTEKHEYTITLDPNIPDDMCHRVLIHNKYYYF